MTKLTEVIESLKYKYEVQDDVVVTGRPLERPIGKVIGVGVRIKDIPSMEKEDNYAWKAFALVRDADGHIVPLKPEDQEYRKDTPEGAASKGLLAIKVVNNAFVGYGGFVSRSKIAHLMDLTALLVCNLYEDIGITALGRNIRDVIDGIVREETEEKDRTRPPLEAQGSDSEGITTVEMKLDVSKPKRRSKKK